MSPSRLLFPVAHAAAALMVPAGGAAAQDAPPPAAPIDAAAGAPTVTAQVFAPDYFSKFAPRTALDMVARIPGFTINDGGRGERGLGQADQNVVVNGKRFSGKTDSLRDQLARIPARDVIRIELVDGNTLDIPGLTGLVANVIYESDGASGQFRWNAGFRAHNTGAQLLGGEASWTGRTGRLEYTAAISNRNDRFGADGPIVLTGPDGALIETQDTKFTGGFDNPKLAANFGYELGPAARANLNLSYGEDFFFERQRELAIPAAGPLRDRRIRTEEDGPEYEVGADIAFPLGPGTLKLIGLERFERDNFASELVDAFDTAAPATGSRYEQVNEAGERIGRLEYGWAMWQADWQLSGEAAFNRLDRRASLAVLAPDGDFTAVPFPGGTGGVREDRYDAALSVSRSLGPRLSVQAILGAEFSTLKQTGAAPNARSFRRPKGSLAVTWKPRPDFDVSATIARRVGQLSFGDFLASVSLENENANDGNNELVPDQSWNLEVEANKRLGAWGSLKLEARQAWFEDFIDWFPLPGLGEARGNIGAATRLHLELSGTINLDPAGFRGARFDFAGVRRWMNVTDPFIGQDRPFSNDVVDSFEADLRYDVPGSDWALGAGMFTNNQAPYSRRYELGRQWEGPTFVDLFAEHKDVAGLTVRATFANALGARNYFRRTVFAAPRPGGAILFDEFADRRIGPIFRFSVSGSF